MTTVLERPAGAPSANGAGKGGMSIAWINPRSLTPDPANERGVISLETDPDLQGLVESIRAVGVKEPLRVYRKGGVTYIISGHRRQAAALLAELPVVPCVIVGAPSHADGEIDRLVSNIQRRDINPVKMAITIKGLREAHPEVSQAALASKLGMSQPALANLVRLLRLPDTVLDYIAEGRLSVGHGLALIRIQDHGHFSDWQGKVTASDNFAMELAQRWVGNNTSVREAEVRVLNELYEQKHIQRSIEETAKYRSQNAQVRASQAKMTVEEMEAKEKEDRRSAMVEGRARTKRVRAAQAAMTEAVLVFAEMEIFDSAFAGPFVWSEHVRMMALALNGGYLIGDTRKAWGLPSRDDLEAIILVTHEKEELLTWCARLAMALMLEIAYDGKSFRATASVHSRDQVEQLAKDAWHVSDAIKKALEEGEPQRLVNSLGSGEKGEGRG